MLRRSFAACLLLAFAVLSPARAADADASSPDALKKLFEDAIAAVKAGDDAKAKAIAAAMVLPNPDAWFAKTFGDDKAKPLAAEYERTAKEFANVFPMLIKARIADNRTNVAVTKIESADDQNATGLQAKALAAMKERTPLYTIRLTEQPGGDRGFTFWSFAVVDGQFRFLNKMNAVGQ